MAEIVGEDLEHLRDADDARRPRNVLAADPLRLAAAVPVLVHVADCGGCGRREAEIERDRRAAIATHLKDLALGPRAGQRQARDSREPPEETLAAADVAEAIGDLFAEVPPVGQPHRAFDDQFVAAKQLVHAGGIARAAGVLEQEGVEQIKTVRFAHADKLGKPQPDHAGARRVPL